MTTYGPSVSSVSYSSYCGNSRSSMNGSATDGSAGISSYPPFCRQTIGETLLPPQLLFSLSIPVCLHIWLLSLSGQPKRAIISRRDRRNFSLALLSYDIEISDFGTSLLYPYYAEEIRIIPNEE